MGIGVSLLSIAVGAILTWAVTADVSGLDLKTVGVILMVVGVAGALISFVFWSSWGGFGGTAAMSSSATAIGSSSADRRIICPEASARRLRA